jgi:ketosteroid isomerase-like protein
MVKGIDRRAGQCSSGEISWFFFVDPGVLCGKSFLAWNSRQTGLLCDNLPLNRRNSMRKSLLALILILGGTCLAQTHKPMKKPVSGGPDKAYMQQIWDAWATLDPSHAAPFYASGPHTFFDIAPLKYSSWAEYEAGVKPMLATIKSATLTVNDDAEVHRHGDMTWGTATIKEDALMKNGKHEMATFRWTVVWEKQDGKWLIVHDHTSQPLQ